MDLSKYHLPLYDVLLKYNGRKAAEKYKKKCIEYQLLKWNLEQWEDLNQK